MWGKLEKKADLVNMERKIALITGITGQDGSYLAELLLEKGYDVHGIIRSDGPEPSEHQLRNLEKVLPRLSLHPGDLGHFSSISRTVREVQPNELYHLAGQSFVSYDFETEFSTIKNNVQATHNVLASIRDFAPNCGLYFAGSSEMFGNCSVAPQTEEMRFNPRSIYGTSKVAAYHLVKNYRELYGIQASVGILYNHESPRRGHEFVTRKITSHVAKIKKGLETKLILGNLEARRDWGYAKDYVDAMWRMLQYGLNRDFVIASGILHTVHDFLRVAFEYVDLDYQEYVVSDEKYFRPDEEVPLVGNPELSKGELNWNPTKNI